jgi:hypothetical protein
MASLGADRPSSPFLPTRRLELLLRAEVAAWRARATVRRMRGGRRQRGRAPLPPPSSLTDASPSSASPVLGVPAHILEEAMLGGAGPRGLGRAPGADLAVARHQG